MLVADEPTTALDVTIQAQILGFIRDLQQRLGTALVLITHDLGVVAEMADQVIVMYAGRRVEVAPVEALFDRPLHPYTRALMQAAPHLTDVGSAKTRLAEIPGTVPPPWDMPRGCAFAPRCPIALSERCLKEEPPLALKEDGHWAACWEDRRCRYLSAAPLLEVCDLAVHFPIRRGLFGRQVDSVRAVDGVSFSIARAKPWASSASPAAASPRPGLRSCGS